MEFSSLNGYQVKDSVARESINYWSDFITPQMYGAKGDGVTDDTQAIQTALNTGKNIFFPEGTYLINGDNSGYGYITEGGIHPVSNTNILLSEKAILKAKANSNGFYNIVSLCNVENVSITGGKIIGDVDIHNGTTGEHGYGIGIYECNNITIENVDISKCWGDGIILGSVDELTGENNNIKIINNHIHYCRRQGISVVIGGKGIVIDKCHIHHISGTAPQSGIDIETNDLTKSIDNIIISNCHIHDTVNYSILFIHCKNCYVSNCILDRGIHNDKTGNMIAVDNSFVKEAVLFAGTTILNNCYLNNVTCSGGSATLNNCFIYAVEGQENLIGFPNDNTAVTKGDTVKFNNCILDTNGLTQQMIIAMRQRAYNCIEFNGCDLHLHSYHYGFICSDIFKITNSNIYFNNLEWAVFTLQDNLSSPEIIFDNVKFFKSGDTAVGYLFSNPAVDGVSIRIVNSQLFGVQRLAYFGGDVGGYACIYMTEGNDTFYEVVGSEMFTLDGGFNRFM